MREDVAYIGAASNIIGVGMKFSSLFVIEAVEQDSLFHLMAAKDLLQTYRLEEVAELMNRIAAKWPAGPEANSLKVISESCKNCVPKLFKIISDAAEGNNDAASDEFFSVRDEMLKAVGALGSMSEWSGVKDWGSELADIILQADLTERIAHRKGCKKAEDDEAAERARWEDGRTMALSLLDVEPWAQNAVLKEAFETWKAAAVGARGRCPVPLPDVYKEASIPLHIMRFVPRHGGLPLDVDECEECKP